MLVYSDKFKRNCEPRVTLGEVPVIFESSEVCSYWVVVLLATRAAQIKSDDY